MGRHKKIRTLTTAQTEYRNSLVKPKAPKPKIKVDTPKVQVEPPTLADFINAKIVYLNNCNFWVNEYKEGRVDIHRFYQTLNAIHEHIVELKQKIKPQK